MTNDSNQDASNTTSKDLCNTAPDTSLVEYNPEKVSIVIETTMADVQSSSGQKQIVKEVNGPKGLEPTRYGDWEAKGRCHDF